MGKSLGRHAFDLRERLPDAVKRPVDGAVRFAAKATRAVRDKKAIQRNGKATVNGLRRRVFGK